MFFASSFALSSTVDTVVVYVDVDVDVDVESMTLCIHGWTKNQDRSRPHYSNREPAIVCAVSTWFLLVGRLSQATVTTA